MYYLALAALATAGQGRRYLESGFPKENSQSTRALEYLMGDLMASLDLPCHSLTPNLYICPTRG